MEELVKSINLVVFNNYMSCKVKLIDEYIEACDRLSQADGNPETIESRKELIEEVVSTFGKSITNIGSGLTMYPGVYGGGNGEIKSEHEFTEDIRKLRGKLKLYRCEIIDSQNRTLQNDQPVFNIQNNNSNDLSVSNSIQITIDIDYVLESIDNLELDSDSKEKLKAMLCELDDYKREGDLKKIKARIPDVVKFAIDKCVDAFIQILPYIGKIVQ